MAVNPLLGSLNFDAIKGSIKEHLKQQDALLDYDFEGSALSALLDVLAYNTMYYAYYANMVASEMFLDTAQRDESIISLVKPLGFVVPGRTSARGKGKIRVGGQAYGRVPKYTKFTGTDNSGIVYDFYTIQEYSLDLDGEAIVSLSEAKTLTKEQPLLIDMETQKGFISGIETDINTLTVEVWDDTINDETGQQYGWREWTRASNVETGLNDSSRVYWLERSELGFFVVFGGNLGGQTVTQVGQSISEGQQVRVTYLTSSGQDGNNVGNFQIQTSGQLGLASVDTVSLSSGGRDKPDIEMIRFFAPKWFAAQDRAVTVDDCRAMLAKNGFVGGDQDPYAQFNVWGGEEMDPPRYGRLFVTLADTAESDPVAASTAIEILEKKTCVSILPEFVNPVTYQVRIAGNVTWEPLRTTSSRAQLQNIIAQTLYDAYPQRFSQIITGADVAERINRIDTALSALSSDLNITLTSDSVPEETGRLKTIQFKNKCEAGTLISDSFTAHSSLDVDEPVYLYIPDDAPLKYDGSQPIRARYYASGLMVDLGLFGKFFPERGLVEFSNKALSAEPVKISVQPADSSQYWNLKENMMPSLIVDITLVR